MFIVQATGELNIINLYIRVKEVWNLIHCDMAIRFRINAPPRELKELPYSSGKGYSVVKYN